jgi:peptide/nickel transport system substrate-binding protein
MKKRLLISFVVCILLATSLISACQTTERTSESTKTTTSTTTSVKSSTTTTAPVTTNVIPKPSSTVSTAPVPAQSHWWDKLGTPVYGGTITIGVSALNPSFDPAFLPNLIDTSAWFESLFFHDWTVDRNENDFKSMFVSDLKYWKGQLAESWQQTDPGTITITIRKDARWQNKAPVNGREFTAYDVENAFHRALGRGSGYTTPNNFLAPSMTNIDTVTATDKYTVMVKFKSPLNIIGVHQFFLMVSRLRMAAPESVKLEGGLKEWQKAVGTSPWMLVDFVPGTSMTLGKSPNYYGYDERHPENKLPYADEAKVLQIPDIATSIAALRTGKINFLFDVPWVQAAALAKTAPDIQQSKLPAFGLNLDERIDQKPFDDIRVRKALNMAIDRQSIAKNYYGGLVDGTPVGIMSPAIQRGWVYPFAEWPEELRAEYTFNLSKARQLMTEAGYPNGFNTNVVAPSNYDINLLQVVKAQLKEIGVNIDIRTMDPASADAFLRSGKQDQMNAWRFTATIWTPWQAIQVRTSKEATNFTYNKDAVIDDMFAKLGTIMDEKEAIKNVKDADLRILQQHWGVFIVPNVSYILYTKNLKGYSGELPQEFRYSYFARYWIEQ